MIKIKDLVIGEGSPKICVPIVEKYQNDILDQAQEIVSESGDLVEWRLDYYEDPLDTEKVIQTADLLQSILGKIPLLVTFRTKKEGGEREIALEDYCSILEKIARSGKADLVDVEVFRGYDASLAGDTFLVEDVENHRIKELIGQIGEFACVIGSYHDFQKTPSRQEVVKRLLFMDAMGVSIPKMAVMPQKKMDVLELMEATLEAKEKIPEKPLITMSMGELGKITRVAGASFSSSVTFGALGKESAPGQIPIKNLREILGKLN